MLPFRSGDCLQCSDGTAYAFCGIGTHPGGLCAVLRSIVDHSYRLVPVVEVAGRFWLDGTERPAVTMAWNLGTEFVEDDVRATTGKKDTDDPGSLVPAGV